MRLWGQAKVSSKKIVLKLTVLFYYSGVYEMEMKFTNEAFGTGESVLLMKVSSVFYRGVP